MSAARYLSASAVADYLQISRNMVDILVKQGRIPPAISLTNRLKRWDREAIDAALAGNGNRVQSRANAAELFRGVADDIAQGRAGRHKAAAGR